MKQKKWMLLVALAIIATGIGWLVLSRGTGDGNSTVPCSEFCGSERSEADQQLLDSVLESPEVLDGEDLATKERKGHKKGEGSTVPVCTLPTGKDRQLLSDIEKPEAPRPLEEPVAADSLHFREDYASLRTDAVRNPNSPENRAGVVSLMEARQRRLGQK